MSKFSSPNSNLPSKMRWRLLRYPTLSSLTILWFRMSWLYFVMYIYIVPPFCLNGKTRSLSSVYPTSAISCCLFSWNSFDYSVYLWFFVHRTIDISFKTENLYRCEPSEHIRETCDFPAINLPVYIICIFLHFFEIRPKLKTPTSLHKKIQTLKIPW